MAKSISCLIIFPSALRKQERWQRQEIQSHQKRRSILSSSRSQKKSSSEKPYRAGQLFARPPSSAAQALSSCSKNLAIRARTFAVSRSFSRPASLLSWGFNPPLGLSGSPPRKRRIDRRSSRGFSFRSSKKYTRKFSGRT